MPTDFNRPSKDDSYFKPKSDHIQYRFNGYLCPKCGVVYQRTPSGDQALKDFPKYGKKKELCKSCA